MKKKNAKATLSPLSLRQLLTRKWSVPFALSRARQSLAESFSMLAKSMHALYARSIQTLTPRGSSASGNAKSGASSGKPSARPQRKKK